LPRGAPKLATAKDATLDLGCRKFLVWFKKAIEPDQRRVSEVTRAAAPLHRDARLRA
jgi:hypothetical protein